MRVWHNFGVDGSTIPRQPRMQDRIRGGEGVVLRYRESRVFVKKSGLASETDTISLPREMGDRANIVSRKMLLGN